MVSPYRGSVFVLLISMWRSSEAQRSVTTLISRSLPYLSLGDDHGDPDALSHDAVDDLRLQYNAGLLRRTVGILDTARWPAGLSMIGGATTGFCRRATFADGSSSARNPAAGSKIVTVPPISSIRVRPRLSRNRRILLAIYSICVPSRRV